MKIIFVGTGSGRVSLNRYHSSLLFSPGNYNLLVDAGDGISRALLHAKIDYNSINGILFTHFHPDHFSGICALIVQMKLNRRSSPLEIFLHKKQVEIVREFLLTSNLLPEKMNFEIKFKPFESNSEFFIEDKLTVLPRENSHLAELREFAHYQERNFFSGSFLFTYKGKNLMYSGDIGSEDDLLLFREFELNILITEVTHLKITGLFEILEVLNPATVYLTHITEDDIPVIKSCLDSRGKTLGNIILAKDRQIIQF